MHIIFSCEDPYAIFLRERLMLMIYLKEQNKFSESYWLDQNKLYKVSK